MAKSTLNIGIIGCGSGGPAAGILLSRAGHRVTLFEKVSSLKPVGAGFLIQPTGLFVLQKLGCLEPVLEYGAKVDRLYGHTTKGRVILNLSYKDLGIGWSGVGLHRASLLHTLSQQMEKDGVELRCGVEIVTLQNEGPNQTLLLAQDGQQYGPYDLVIVADGARSKLREQLGIPVSVKEYEWGALWFMGKDKEGEFSSDLYQVFEGNQTFLGFLPTGYAPNSMKVPLVSCFWSLHMKQYQAWLDKGLRDWKDKVLSLAPRAEEFLTQIESSDQLIRARYHDVVMSRWSNDRAVVIGDAAHAMSPQLGQGVNLALFDAMVLSQCIAEQPTVSEALQSYNQQRKHHLGFYQFATRWATPFFQSSLSSLGWIRDLLFPVGLAIPPFRKQMLRSMAGVKRGIFRFSIPMEELKHKQLPAVDQSQKE